MIYDLVFGVDSNFNLHKLVLFLLLVVGKILPDDECQRFLKVNLF